MGNPYEIEGGSGLQFTALKDHTRTNELIIIASANTFQSHISDPNTSQTGGRLPNLSQQWSHAKPCVQLPEAMVGFPTMTYRGCTPSQRIICQQLGMVSYTK